jgi:hypothetical protein
MATQDGVRLLVSVATILVGECLAGTINGSFTPVPNNGDDPGAPSPNHFNIDSATGNNLPLSLGIPISNSGGITDYFVQWSIFNGTQTVWTGYTFQLGYGIDASFVSAGNARVSVESNDSRVIYSTTPFSP